MRKQITLKKIEDYGKYLVKEERSPSTIKKYVRDITHFYNFLGQDKHVTKERVIEYKSSLINEYKPSSMNSMLVSLNGFLCFTNMSECKVKLHKIQKRVFVEEDKKLTKKEYEKLIKTAKKRENEKLGLIIQTIGATGIRVSEHKYITVDAVKQGKAIISNKGKMREILIPQQLRKLLLNYCRKNKIEHGSVFITKTGNPLDRSNIWAMMKKLCQEANVDRSKVYPHNLRHLFAFTFYSIEKNLAHLADLLGHSNIETTRIYTKTSIQECYFTLNKMGLITS